MQASKAPKLLHADTKTEEHWLQCDCCDRWQKATHRDGKREVKPRNQLWKCTSCLELVRAWQEAPLLIEKEKVRPLHRHNNPRSGRFSVVVIGAGVSGLAAARALEDQVGAHVTVLEARERIGRQYSNVSHVRI